jgi:hypothetical protein
MMEVENKSESRQERRSAAVPMAKADCPDALG